MMNLLWRIAAGIMSLFLAKTFVPGVYLAVIPGESIYFGIQFTQDWQIFVLVGSILGLINFFIKPILDRITWPLKILTLGFFSLIINMAIIWSLDILFLEFQVLTLSALFWTTLICWGINLILK